MLSDLTIRNFAIIEQIHARFGPGLNTLTGETGAGKSILVDAINLLLGVADAQTDSAPLVAISAQVGLGRIYKETHQSVDLVSMFKPVTKWADTLLTPAAAPEMIRNAFHTAQAERPGAVRGFAPEGVYWNDLGTVGRLLDAHHDLLVARLFEFRTSALLEFSEEQRRDVDLGKLFG